MTKKTPGKQWMKIFFVAVLMGLPMLVVSHFGNAGGESNHTDGLPVIFWLQVVNFLMYFGAILYFARTPVRDMFQGRYEGFFSAVKRAEAAKAEAEAKRKEIRDRLSKLEATREESISNARNEALALKNQIIEEARALSMKLKMDAERTARVEVEKAKFELREELLTQSVQLSRRILTDKMQEQDQKRLQSEFVEKIQVVSQ